MPPVIDWTTAAKGARVVPCLLIAGVSRPILPASVAFTTVTWTGVSDAAWHVGNLALSPLGLLAVGRDAPELVVDERANPSGNTLDVGAVSVRLNDHAGLATQMLFNRDMLPSARLTATLEKTDVAMIVDRADPFAALSTPFDVHLGREVVQVSAVDTVARTLTIGARGKYGTMQRRYVVAAGLGAPVVYGPPASGALSLPSVIGRRATVWALRLNGTTATDPTLLFDGRVGAGVRLDGPGIEIPLDHCSRVMSYEIPEDPVTFAGYAHPSIPGGDETPLAVYWQPSGGSDYFIRLTADPSNPRNRDGWHPSRETFLSDFRAEIAAEGLGGVLAVNLSAGGYLTVSATGTGSLGVTAAWDEDRGGGAIGADPSITLATPMPAACAWLDGTLHLSSTDIARVPPVPTVSVPAGTVIQWALELQGENEDDDNPRSARITSVPSGTDTVVVSPIGVRPYRELLVTEATPARLVLYVQSPDWLDALRYSLQALAAQTGQDWLDDSVDWSGIAQAARTSGATLPPAREYRLDSDSGDVTSLLWREARANGLCLVPQRGRVGMVKVEQAARTEPLADTITKHDLLIGSPVPRAELAQDGLCTRVKFTFAPPSKDTATIVDASAEASSGQGATIEVAIPGGSIVPPLGALDGATQQHLLALAQGITGLYREPYWTVTVVTSIAHAGTQIGQNVQLTEWYVPNGRGTRGLVGAYTKVMGRRVSFSTGTTELSLLVCDPGVVGYSPEAVVASIAGRVLTLDVSLFGDHGFADPTLPDGSLRLDGGASCFVVGDVVTLNQWDSATPRTPEQFTLTQVGPGASLTVDHDPDPAWAGIAAAGLAATPPGPTCAVCFAEYGDATRARSGAVPAQHEYAFLADGTTLVLDGATPAQRLA